MRRKQGWGLATLCVSIDTGSTMGASPLMIPHSKSLAMGAHREEEERGTSLGDATRRDSGLLLDKTSKYNMFYFILIKHNSRLHSHFNCLFCKEEMRNSFTYLILYPPPPQVIAIQQWYVPRCPDQGYGPSSSLDGVTTLDY